MFLFLSHPLDPEGYAWPGEPVVKTRQCTDITDDFFFCSYESTLPNHCGTHMDAPRHFVPGGLSINDLSMDYFCHTSTALLEIPKTPVEGIYKKDLEPFADVLSQVSFALIRTGIEQYRDTDKKIYQEQGCFIHPDAGIYLTENFPNLKGIGIDFLAVASPSPDVPADALPKDCHRNLLGYFTGKFVTLVEDMHLADIPKGARITRFFNAPLLIKGLDSTQVVCIAEIEENH